MHYFFKGKVLSIICIRLRSAFKIKNCAVLGYEQAVSEN